MTITRTKLQLVVVSETRDGQVASMRLATESAGTRRNSVVHARVRIFVVICASFCIILVVS